MNSMSCGSNSNSSNSSSNSSDSDHSDSRLTVADILSSMASGEVVTPTTFATLEGFSTGIPTRTTPTLTPTTLRNIEQTFIELQSVPAPNNHQHQHQAGFVPPVVNSITNTSTTSTITSTYQNIKEDSLWYSAPSPPTRVGTRKASGRMGGRRPNRQEKLSPEEEERRRVRRERNKLAAARCRKRRLDHTNSLIVETDELEERRQILQKEIGDLKSQKQQLQFVLDAHRCIYKNNNNNNSNTNGKLNGMSNSNHMKEIMDNNTTNLSMSPSPPPELMNNSSFRLESKHPTRPTSLHLPSNMSIHSTNLRLNTSVSVSDMTGVPISTPSNGMFNFDALMEGGTGLTPITSGLTPIIPTCSSQQRNCNTEMASPESLNPPKLVSL